MLQQPIATRTVQPEDLSAIAYNPASGKNITDIDHGIDKGAEKKDYLAFVATLKVSVAVKVGVTLNNVVLFQFLDSSDYLYAINFLPIT